MDRETQTVCTGQSPHFRLSDLQHGASVGPGRESQLCLNSNRERLKVDCACGFENAAFLQREGEGEGGERERERERERPREINNWCMVVNVAFEHFKI